MHVNSNRKSIPINNNSDQSRLSILDIVQKVVLLFLFVGVSLQVKSQFVQPGLKLRNLDPMQKQGWAVAIAANDSVAAISNSGGGLWVYSKQNGFWIQNSQLSPSDGGAAGSSLAISADGTTIFTGGIGDNLGMGACWVFVKTNGTWIQQGPKLVGSGSIVYGPFWNGVNQGTSVSISSDGNTAVVGGSFDNYYRGAVWTFIRSGGVWTQLGSKLEGTNTYDFFGIGVDISGDGNTLIVGARDGSLSGQGHGAFIYTRNGGSWTSQGSKLLSNQSVWGVSISMDGNTAFIGDPFDENSKGSCHVYTRTSNNWTKQAKLIGGDIAGSNLQAQQGYSVSTSASGNRVIIGGNVDNDSIGAVWVFERINNVWQQAGTKLVGVGRIGKSQQGHSVDISGDGTTIIFGGPGDSGDLGASWIYKESISIKLINPNPSLVTLSDTLDSNLSLLDTTKIVLGAATDSITKIVLYAETSSAVKFSLVTPGDNGALSTFPNQSVESSMVVVPSNNGKVAAIYRVPDGFGYHVGYPDKREITIKAEDLGNGRTVLIPLQLYSPPIVMVHGLWSDPSVWYKGGGFVNFLKKNGLPNIFLANYKAHNYKTFDPDNIESESARAAINNSIEEALTSFEKNKIAVSQVDMIAHSLGGLHARVYSQGGSFQYQDFVGATNYYKGSIHKLITLATPHRGSPLGPELDRHKNDIIYIPKAGGLLVFQISVKDALRKANMIVGSSLGDFAINSPALGRITQTPRYKTYAIAADANSLIQARKDMDYYCRIALKKTLNSVMARKLPCVGALENDLIVPVSSQMGFDGISGKGIVLSNIAHANPATTTITNALPVGQKTVELLLSQNQSDFGFGFPSPASRAVDCNTQEQRITVNNPNDNKRQNNALNTGNKCIVIDSAIRGGIYTQGDSLLLKFTPINGAIPTTSLFMVGDLGWFPVDDLVNYSVRLTLPANNQVGKIPVLALTIDQSGLTLGDTSHIFLQPNGVLDKITISSAKVILDSLHPQEQLIVIGQYVNGSDTIHADITQAALGTMYASRNNIVRISGDGMVTAGSTGFDTITVINSGKQIKVRIDVQNVLPFTTVKSGQWQDADIWTSGIVPGENDAAKILAEHIVVLDTLARVKTLLIEQGGELAVEDSTGSLIVGSPVSKANELACRGNLKISGGNIFLYGNFYMQENSSLSMTSGKFSIDGNSGNAASSVADYKHLFDIHSEVASFNFVGGTIQFVNPPLGQHSQAIRCSHIFGDESIIVFGDGVSTMPSNNINGFGGVLLPQRIGKLIINTTINNNNRVFKLLNPLSVRTVDTVSGKLELNSLLEIRE